MVHQAGNKLKAAHGELLVFVQPCLSMLMAMLNGPGSTELRPLLLELCLTLPAQVGTRSSAPLFVPLSSVVSRCVLL